MAISKTSSVPVHTTLQDLCVRTSTVMSYDMISDEYQFRFKLDPKGVFVVNYRCASYIFALAKDREAIVNVFIMAREQAIYGPSIFYIIQECLRVGNMK